MECVLFKDAISCMGVLILKHKPGDGLHFVQDQKEHTHLLFHTQLKDFSLYTFLYGIFCLLIFFITDTSEKFLTLVIIKKNKNTST